ncbi:MAG: sel1 repeat family protein [Planctomycetes bacterium]|nr:sel1 repeat family protein [Planctomycetota bacterium]
MKTIHTVSILVTLFLYTHAHLSAAQYWDLSPQTLPQTIQKWKIAADEGNQHFASLLVAAYSFGYGTNVDYPQAKHYWQLSQDQPMSQLFYALCARERQFMMVVKNDNKIYNPLLKSALAAFEEAAAQDDIGALCFAGICAMELGRYPQTLELLQQAYEQEYTPASFWLAYVYSYRKKDKEKSFPMMKIAAEHGIADAQRELGDFYNRGFGCEKDRATALEWFKKAAAQKHRLSMLREAQYNSRNPQSIILLQEAFDQGEMDAGFTLASRYERGNHCEKNIDNALNLVSKIYTICDPPISNRQKYYRVRAAYEQARIHDLFKEHEHYQQAAKWYQFVIDNNTNAKDYRLLQTKYQYAQHFAQGLSGEKDLQRAAAMYRYAADKNLGDAQVAYADCLRDGSGCEQNHQLALEYYQKSLKRLHKRHASRGAIQMSMAKIYENTDIAKAIKMYETAAQSGDSSAALLLAQIYSDGKLLSADPIKAQEHMARAAALGNKDARHQLEDHQREIDTQVLNGF